MARKLASIQKIKYVKEIPDANNIEVVGVLGWECVAKKGEFKEGDFCVYFEIDSLLPELPCFEFLRSSSWNKKLSKFRLKTARLRGKLSQGLALPINILWTYGPIAFPTTYKFFEGEDLTNILDIEKYEPPIPAELDGAVRPFSWNIEKTDETRIQLNDVEKFLDKIYGKPYYISSKLDGTSGTILIKDGEVHVCGRNYSYIKNDSNTYWKLFNKYNFQNVLENYPELAFQGEVVGPGIQSNKLGLKDHEFRIFNIIDVCAFNRKLHLFEMKEICNAFNLDMVPVIEEGLAFEYKTQEELLAKAEGYYFDDGFKLASPKQDREGIVIRAQDQSISFKAISNRFLLGKGNDE